MCDVILKFILVHIVSYIEPNWLLANRLGFAHYSTTTVLLLGTELGFMRPTDDDDHWRGESI